MNWADPEWHEFIVELATYDYGANPAAVIALANYRTAQQMALDLSQPSEVVRAWDQLRRRAIAELRRAFDSQIKKYDAPAIHSMFPYVGPCDFTWREVAASPRLLDVPQLF